MKILILNPNLIGGGTYVRSFYFSRELARHGHQVTLMTVATDSTKKPKVYYKRDWLDCSAKSNGEGPWFRVIEGPNLGYHWLPGWGSGPLDISLRIKEIRQGNYNVIYGFEHHPNVAWPVYFTRGSRQYRFFSDWCDWYAGVSNHLGGNKLAHKIDGYFEEQIRFKAQKVSVISQVLGERARAIGIPESRVVHIPEGVATEYFPTVPQLESRRLLGIPEGLPVVLTSNDWEAEQQIRIIAQTRQVVPEALFLFIGKPSIGAPQLAERFNVSDRIIFTGWVSDENYPHYLNAADVCFLPLADTLLHRARWPSKILDYLAAARPVVTNNVGEVGLLFRQHEIGLLVGHNEKEFAQGIVSLIKDKEYSRLLGERAREVMVEEWDWKILGKRIARLVEEE